MVKVLFAAYQPGAASLLEELTPELAALGHEVSRLYCGPAADVWPRADMALDGSPEDATELTDILKSLEPDTVITGTTAVVDFEKRLWASARELEIPTVGMIDSWMNLRERFSLGDGGGDAAPDAVCVIDDAMKSELQETIGAQTKLHVVGQPYLERVCERVIASRGAKRQSSKAPTFLFVSDHTGGLATGKNKLDPFAAAGLLIENVAGHGPLSILIKPHPREPQRAWNGWIAEQKLPDEVDLRLTDRPVETLLERADAVVGISSVALVAAGLAGLPVLALQLGRSGSPNRQLEDMKGVSLVTERKRVSGAVEQLFKDACARHDTSDSLTGFAGSAQRAVEVIESVILDDDLARPADAACSDPNGHLGDLFDELFPICRSITGPGLRQSLDILARYVPLRMDAVRSGTRVFDWTAPPEWRIRSARLTGPGGEVISNFERNNLEVVNYSEAVDEHLGLDDLLPHLHSMEHLPDAIPYVTSYYRKRWGFCLPHKTLKSLLEGTYHARIDSEFAEGEINFGHCFLKGESEQEVLLSSYLCHPSMANNELSGPLVLAALYHRIKGWKRRRYTYRFVLNPETIGSLCYLRRHGQVLRERMVAGLVLNCLGGPNKTLSYKMSRRGDSLLDQLMARLHEDREYPIEVRQFTPEHGSDERQYCSPGFNLPVGQLARAVPGTFDEYHTSLDTKAFMGIKQLEKSVDHIEQVLRILETSGYFLNCSPHGEPQLGKRGLYPTINAPDRWSASSDAEPDRGSLKHILHILSYADGEHSMMQIADKCGCGIRELVPAIEQLEDAGLLRLAPKARITRSLSSH